MSRRILSRKDIIATDPASPFGGAVSPMQGSGPQSTGEASPSHQGPPPAASNPETQWTCPNCGVITEDAEDLEDHLYRKHHVRTRIRS